MKAREESGPGRLPAELYTADQVRELDRLAGAEGGLQGFELMRRAALRALEELLQVWPDAARLIIFCGAGNNGGDGFLLACLARARGLEVLLLCFGEAGRSSQEARLARDQAEKEGVPVYPCGENSDEMEAAFRQWSGSRETLIVDALLGTGLRGEVRPGFRETIDRINGSGLPVMSLDIPSGLCSDTGRILGAAVRAELTLTFVGLKQGLFTGEGPSCSGRIAFSNLGIPPAVYESAGPASAYRLDMDRVRPLFRPRRATAHKGDFGHVLLVGGDHGFGGAILLAAEAAARGGAGLTSVLTRQVHVQPLLARRPEVMAAAMDEVQRGARTAALRRASALVEKATAVVLGPGLGRELWGRRLWRIVLQTHTRRDFPLVVDADGLNLLAECRREETDATEGPGKLHRGSWVLTPHPGEAARLLGSTIAEVQADRFAAVRELQSRWGGACLLKGAGSLVCYRQSSGEQVVEVCSEGNPGMASGGMGDVLSGLIGALLAQGFSVSDSLRCAVCIHGQAADDARDRSGERGLLASDLPDFMRRLINPDGRSGNYT